MPSELGTDWGRNVDAPTATRTRPVSVPATDGSDPAGPLPRVERPGWLTTYVAVLVAVDAVAMAAATLVATRWWLGAASVVLHIRSLELPYSLLPLATVPTWLVILALAGAYDVGPFGAARGLWTSIVRAGAQLLAVVAVTYYVLHLQMLGRGVLVAVIPLAVVFTVAGRAAVSLVLLRARRQGRARRAALVAGSRRAIEAVVAQLAEHPGAGITPIDALVVGERAGPLSPDNGTSGSAGTTGPGGKGAAVGGGSTSLAGANGTAIAGGSTAGGDTTVGGTAGAGTNGGAAGGGGGGWVPVAEGDAAAAITGALVASGAEAVILTGGLAKGQLREIAWRLQGTGVELLVVPAPGELDGLRSQVRPVAGLPLLYVD